jgi:DNA-directed RNA polymerase specialized sigma24 family protein
MLFKQSDPTLVNKALRGSESSWLKLVRRHETRLYNYCLRMCGNESDAMDLLQEIF